MSYHWEYVFSLKKKKKGSVFVAASLATDRQAGNRGNETPVLSENGTGSSSDTSLQHNSASRLYSPSQDALRTEQPGNVFHPYRLTLSRELE